MCITTHKSIELSMILFVHLKYPMLSMRHNNSSFYSTVLGGQKHDSNAGGGGQGGSGSGGVHQQSK